MVLGKFRPKHFNFYMVEGAAVEISTTVKRIFDNPKGHPCFGPDKIRALGICWS